MASAQKAFGKAVRRLRREAGFSQERFAQAAGIHRTFMGEIERGDTNVSLDTITRIAKSLRMSVSELFQAVES